MTPLPENSVIGILGGGQLGRMSAIAAAPLGYRCHVFAPAGDAPAVDVAFAATRADYDDADALAAFASKTASVITEFENVPVAAVRSLADRGVLVCPGGEALAVAQNRLSEKTHAQNLGIATPRFMAVKTQADLARGLDAFHGGGGILKTCRFGYDGRGQVRLDKKANAGELAEAIKQMGIAPDILKTEDALILEEIVDFSAEVSFLIARHHNGAMHAWDASHNRHDNGILIESQAPASPQILPPALAKLGIESAKSLAESLGVVGLLAVEMFITQDGKLLFNEMAPRPHNSYHWTIEGAATSQFTQLIRIAANLPLASCRTIPSANSLWQMTNLLGDDITGCMEKTTGEAFIHRYGKGSISPRRKMGHITRRLG